MNLKKLKEKSRLYSLLLLTCIFVACSITPVDKEIGKEKNDQKLWEEWVLPENKYPKIFELYKGSTVPVYRIKINPQSLEIDCTKRNDYPHYWCNIEAEVIHSFSKYPNKVITSFMSSRNIAFVNKYKEHIEKIKKNNKRAFISTSYSIFRIDDNPIKHFSGVFIGLETEDICINWSNFFRNCLKGTREIEL
jgi:hypothetical protein